MQRVVILLMFLRIKKKQREIHQLNYTHSKKKDKEFNKREIHENKRVLGIYLRGNRSSFGPLRTSDRLTRTPSIMSYKPPFTGAFPSGNL